MIHSLVKSNDKGTKKILNVVGLLFFSAFAYSIYLSIKANRMTIKRYEKENSINQK